MSISSLLGGLFVNKKSLFLTAIPAISSIALFGTNSDIPEYKIIVNYNGQADLLLSLQIPPDYYPYQFKKTNLYDYLTNTNKYLVANQYTSSNKQLLGQKLQQKINNLLSQIKEFGPSLWNEDLYDTGIVFRNNQFWNTKKTDLLLIEQFISDDYTKIQDAYDLLPAHKTLITTNYRISRDPYTIFSKGVYDCFKNSHTPNLTNNSYKDTKICEKFKKYMQDYNLSEVNSLYRSGRFIQYWNNLLSKNSELENLLKQENLFSSDKQWDKKLAEKYQRTIFSDNELNNLKEWMKDSGSSATNKSEWTLNYISKNHSTSSEPAKVHHPALEQQIIPGTAPLSEGSQKDIIIFLYQISSLIKSYVEDNNSTFSTTFSEDYRKKHMENIFNNAKLMSKNINERITNIREYFKHIKVVDSSFDPQNPSSNTNSKTFTVLTYPPSAFGAGEATIQSISKFPFIYSDIGLKQPMPNNFETHELTHNINQNIDKDEIFASDDNGWWWKVGNVVLDASSLLKFKGTTDTLMILANEDDWNLLQDSSSGILSAASSLLKDNFEATIDINKIQGNENRLKQNKQYKVSYNKYHLWNEGLRSPIALNLLLDNLVDIFQRQYDTGDLNDKYSKAMDWGDYWHNHFLSGTDSNS